MVVIGSYMRSHEHVKSLVNLYKCSCLRLSCLFIGVGSFEEIFNVSSFKYPVTLCESFM